MSADTEFETIAGRICEVFNANAKAEKKTLTAAFDKAGINYADPNIALKAAANGRTDVLIALHKAGVNMNSIRNEQDYTLLHLAAENGHEATVTFLVGAGVYLYPKTKPEKLTPAHVAAYNGKTNIVKLLCNLDRSLLKEPDTNGNTLVHWAAWQNQLEILKYALEKDPSLAKITNTANETPLAFCKHSPLAASESVAYLQQFEDGASPSAPGK